MSSASNSTGTSYAHDAAKGFPSWATVLIVIVGSITGVLVIWGILRAARSQGGSLPFHTTDTDSTEMSEASWSRQLIQPPPPVYSPNSYPPLPPYTPNSMDPVPRNQASIKST
ncbi:hypothetical protein EDC04DRAFT_2902186 [Pisolithus marmoratus]|nr:hypothetical protein EDC04DRAFT_2902186 [Pisolithus marmoratus]